MTHTAKVILSILGLSACYAAFVLSPRNDTGRKRHELEGTLTDEKWLDALKRMSDKEVDTLHRFVFEFINTSRDTAHFLSRWTDKEFVKNNYVFIEQVNALKKKYSLLPAATQNTTTTSSSDLGW